MAPDEPANGTPVTWRDLGNLGVMRRLDAHADRIDRLESWADKWRGAFVVPAALLIVTNLILALVAVLVMVRG